MKKVMLRFRGGLIPEAEMEVDDGPTKPEMIVPVPGAFDPKGYSSCLFRFRWYGNDEDGRDVYIFQGVCD